MLGPHFSKIANDIGCIKLLSTGIGFLGHSLSESQFKLCPAKVLLKRSPTASLPYCIPPHSHHIADTCGGRKVLIPAGMAEKGRTISLKLCYESGRFQRNPMKKCIQLSGNALGIDFTYFFCSKPVTSATLTTALNIGTPKICFIIRRQRLTARKHKEQWRGGGALPQPHDSLCPSAAGRKLPECQPGYAICWVLCTLLLAVNNKYPQY